MKKLLLLCACLLALAAPLQIAAAPPADIVVVRIHEKLNGVTAIITRGEGKSEKIEFEGGRSDESLKKSSEGYYKLIQRFYQEGYVLQNSIAMPASNYYGYITLVFVKAQ